MGINIMNMLCKITFDINIGFAEIIIIATWIVTLLILFIVLSLKYLENNKK